MKIKKKKKDYMHISSYKLCTMLCNANIQDAGSYCVQHNSTNDNGGGKEKRMENLMEYMAGTTG